MKKGIRGLLAAVLVLAVPAYGQDEDTDSVDFVIGGGLLISPEYADFIDDAYGALYETSGMEGWLDLYLGIEIRPAPQFGILLGCEALINGVDAVGGPLDETYANIIVAPSVYGQLYFTETRMFYINGGVSLPMPDTSSDYFEYENNGLGLGANIGAEIASVLRLEVGYSYIPVTVKATSGNPIYTSGQEEDYNFGGLQFRAFLAF